MKLFIISTCCAFILLSCATTSKIIPIKGQYPSTPIQIISDKPFDTVWSNLIDFFAQKSLSIKIIDRSSGLIVSERSLMPTTMENDNGIVMDLDAWIVVAKEKLYANRKPESITGGYYSPNNKIYYINKVTADWNVRIKPYGNKTIINANIGIVKYEPMSLTEKSFIVSSYRSTGVFENLIANAIK